MPAIFWFIAIACVLLVILLAVCNLGAFVLSLRAGRAPPYGALVRGLLVLFAFFVLPRFLPYPLLNWAVLATVLLWELAVWGLRRWPSKQRRSVHASINH